PRSSHHSRFACRPVIRRTARRRRRGIGARQRAGGAVRRRRSPIRWRWRAVNAIIDTAFSRNRVVTILLLLVLATGVLAYARIAKESAPDVPIPIIYVSVIYEGISPEDAERLLVRPLERELQ